MSTEQTFQPVLDTTSALSHEATSLSLGDDNHTQQFRKEGTDWFAMFNLNTPANSSQPRRNLDVDLVHSLRHDSVVCSIRFSPDGNFVATGCDHTTEMYNVITGERVCVLVDDSVPRSQDHYIRSLCFSPDGRYLATGAEDGKIRIWSTQTLTLQTLLSGNTDAVYALDYSPDGQLLVSGSGDKTVRVWNTDGLYSGIQSQGQREVCVLVVEAVPGFRDDQCVTSIAISPDSRLIAAASVDSLIRIWDVQSRMLVTLLRGHADSVYSISFTRDGAELISGSLDCTVKRWDITPLYRCYDQQQPQGEFCSCKITYRGHKDYVLCIALSHDVNHPQWLISSAKDRNVKFWDMTLTDTDTTPRPEVTLTGHTNSVIAVHASPAGGLLATAGGDWYAKIWRYSTLA